MIDKILSKLEITEKEKELFKKLKDNYFISDTLFIKDNNKYNIKIEYKNENDYFYTLKLKNKIIYKNKSKKQLINLIKKMLEV